MLNSPGYVRPGNFQSLPSSNVTTDATAPVAGLHGPDLPAPHAAPDSFSARSPAEVYGALDSYPQGLTAATAASRLAALDTNCARPSGHRSSGRSSRHCPG
jgi:hypothetical protein